MKMRDDGTRGGDHPFDDSRRAAHPDLMNPSRKKRIAQGAGVDIAEVNRLVKQFGDMKKLMKQLPGMAGGGKRKGPWRTRRYAWKDEAAVLNKCVVDAVCISYIL